MHGDHPTLHFAAVVADHIRGRGTAGHFAFQLLESLPRLSFTIVHESDGVLGRHRPAGYRPGIVADGLVHKIAAIIFATDGPFETDRFHRAGAHFRITVRHQGVRGDGLFFNRRLFRLAKGFRLIKYASNRRERMIGGIALTHNLTPPLYPIAPEPNPATSAAFLRPR